jgi:hypothetical protein
MKFQVLACQLLVMVACGCQHAEKRTDELHAPVDAIQVQQEIQLYEKVLPFLPDRGPALFGLAHDYAHLGDLPKAMSLLKQCLALREGFDPGGDPEFLLLNKISEFSSLVQQVHREFPSVQSARLAFTVPEKDLIPEGLAVDHSRYIFYVSGINVHKIISIKKDGTVSDFIRADQYDVHSICGIKVEPGNGSVWANVCPYKATSELLHFDRHGRLLERYSPSDLGPHLLNDLVLRNSDEIYLTDSLSNRVYQFNRKTHSFRALSFPRLIYYPNGIALSTNGLWLYVSDAFGTLQYDFRDRKVREIDPGPFRTVSGFDGLYWYRNSLVGIQNGMGSARIGQFQLSSNGLRVTKASTLENRSEFVRSPTTGAIDRSRFYFIANSDFENWKDGKIVDVNKVEPVRIGVLDLQ